MRKTDLRKPILFLFIAEQKRWILLNHRALNYIAIRRVIRSKINGDWLAHAVIFLGLRKPRGAN